MIKVLKKIDVILGVVFEQGTVSFTDIQKAVGIHKATLSNILKSLVELQMLRRDRHGAFRIGPRLVTLAEAEVLADRLSGIATTTARGLAERLRGRAVFAVVEGIHRHAIAEFEPSTSLSIKTDEHYDRMFYSTSTGRILLAYMSPGKLEEILRTYGLPDATWWPVATTRKSLTAVLATIREQAVAHVTHPDGYTEMTSVPVHYPDGEFCGALGLAVAAHDVDEKRRAEILAGLEEGAAEMTRIMEIIGIHDSGGGRE